MQQTIGRSDEIPSSFTDSPDRPFEMVGVRDQYIQSFDRPNERLTDEQVQELAKKAQFNKSTERIDTLSDIANADSRQVFEERKLYNLSLKQIGFRISDTWVDMIDDLLHFNPRDGFRGFLDVFIRDDRLIYLGITMMIFSISALLIRSV